MATDSTPGRNYTLMTLATDEETKNEDDSLQLYEHGVEVLNSSLLLPLRPPPSDLNTLDVVPYFELLTKSGLVRSHAFEEWNQNKHLIHQEVLRQFCLVCYHASKQSLPVDLSELDHYWAGFFKGVALERTLSLNDTLSTLLSKFETILHQSNLYTELQSLLNTQVISVSEGQVVMTKATLQRLEAGIAKLEALLSKMESHSNQPLPAEVEGPSNNNFLPCHKKPCCRRNL